jgi:acetyl-CoA carboxylase carboxyltransferase component
MGGNQAADTLLSLKIRDAEKSGKPLSPEAIEQLRETIRSQYQSQTDIRYGASRGWVDAIIAPDQTRRWLSAALSVIRDENRMESRCQAREI